MLFGQPELADKVANLKQLEQRIAIKCHLDRFDRSEMEKYVVHRLSVAGRKDPVFGDDACDAIHGYSDGIPRRINHVCDLALLTGFGRKADGIDRGIVDAAIEDFGL
jgi:general secretion pathway protein A